MKRRSQAFLSVTADAADASFEWEDSALPGRYTGPDRRSQPRRTANERRRALRLEIGIENRRRNTGRRTSDRQS